MSSPRTWGCFFDTYRVGTSKQVFPTHVGVFLYRGSWMEFCIGLPHARGGVSEDPPVWYRYLWSSPRTWGCFLGTLCKVLSA